MEYSYDGDITVVTENEEEILRISTAEFLTSSQELFKDIKDGGVGNGAFEIPSLNCFLNKIHCEKIKAKSQDKSDIHVVIHDYHTGMQPNLGFSIKSEAGAKATLLNASKHTIFKYEIKGGNMDDEKMNTINAISTKKKVQDRIVTLMEYGAEMKYISTSKTLNNNLRMIDSLLPCILGRMIADAYVHRDMDIKNATKRTKDSNPFGYDLSDNQDFYGYKIKSLLSAIALGMVPATPWTGIYDATGGYIIVKNDGDVICFHIYDRNLLEDYLLKNTKFDTPKSKINDAKVIKENGKYFFTLGLQIRFK